MSEAPKKHQASIVPVLDEDVERAALFLHENMNSRFSAQVWAECLRRNWLENAPNHGFMLVDDADRIVGMICSIYSEQVINGKAEAVCNPHSWIVLPDYRSQSVALVLAVIRQPGFHFTMFTPNQSGLEIFAYLKFKPLDKTTCRTVNLPSAIFSRRVKIIRDRDDMLAALSAEDRQKLSDHLDFHWLTPMVFKSRGRAGFLLIKQQRYKRMKSAQVLYQSDSELFLQCWGSIRTFLLMKMGIVTTRMESRLIPGGFDFWCSSEDDHQRFYMSPTLRQEDIQYLYSEMVTLDL